MITTNSAFTIDHRSTETSSGGGGITGYYTLVVRITAPLRQAHAVATRFKMWVKLSVRARDTTTSRNPVECLTLCPSLARRTTVIATCVLIESFMLKENLIGQRHFVSLPQDDICEERNCDAVGTFRAAVFVEG
jgi:hypothetical protein